MTYRVMVNDGTNTDRGQYRDVEAESPAAAAFLVGQELNGALDSVTVLVPPAPVADTPEG
jgi:hypothetical protein